MPGGLWSRFTALGNLTYAILLWDTFKPEMLDATEEVTGKRQEQDRILSGRHRYLLCGLSDLGSISGMGCLQTTQSHCYEGTRNSSSAVLQRRLKAIS